MRGADTRSRWGVLDGGWRRVLWRGLETVSLGGWTGGGLALESLGVVWMWSFVAVWG